MIRWWFFFIFLLKFYLINCTRDDQCIYILKRFDNISDECISNECFNIINPESLIIKSKRCKISFLSLSFSSYEKYILFRNNLQWKLSDLFLSSSLNNHLILFLNEFNSQIKPFDQTELIHLGTNIHYFTLYIKNLHNKHLFNGLIHYHSNNSSQWNIIKIKM